MAGILQAGDLVQQLARRGEADGEALAVSIRSLFTIDAEDTQSIYGGVTGVSMGLNSLHEKLGNRRGAADFEIARYVFSMIQLEAKLRREPEMVQQIGKRIHELGTADHLSNVVNDALFEQLGDVYAETISLLQPRIVVQGKHGHLAKALIAARVRATLLAGIRSAYLWAQLGGRRWHLFLKRSIYAAHAGLILSEMQCG